MMKLILTFLFILINAITLSAYARPFQIPVGGDTAFIKGWTATATPEWIELNNQKIFVLTTLLTWRKDQSIKLVTAMPSDLDSRIQLLAGGAKIYLMARETKLQITTTDDLKQEVTIKIPSRLKPYLITRSCFKLEMKFKLITEKPSSYLAGVTCQIKDKKIFMTFSAPTDTSVDSTLFEISGKGESTRVYEFKMLNEAIATKGLLGTISWGNESEQNTLQIGGKGDQLFEKDEKMKLVLKTKDKGKDRFSVGFLGVSFASVHVKSDNLSSGEMALFATGEIANTVGKYRFGYFASIDVLAFGASSVDKISDSRIFAAPVYWLNTKKTNFGLILGAKWITIDASKISAGASAQSYCAGLAVDGEWFSKSKIHIRATFSPISEKEMQGSDMSAQLRHDVTLFKKNLSTGITFESFSLRRPPSSKFTESSIGLVFGLGF